MSHRTLLVAVTFACAFALPACAAAPASDVAPTPAQGAPTQGTTAQGAPAQGAGSITGTWTSPSCGARTYERRLTLEAGGTFSAEDRVSPCPPGVVCVWAGIVFTRGTYTVVGGEVRLAAEAARNPGRPLPGVLVIDPATGSIVEAEDGQRCVYTRAR